MLCERIGCQAHATHVPDVSIKPQGGGRPVQVALGLYVCAEHASQQAADDLVSPKLKEIMDVACRAGTGAGPDWDTLSVSWRPLDDFHHAESAAAFLQGLGHSSTIDDLATGVSDNQEGEKH